MIFLRLYLETTCYFCVPALLHHSSAEVFTLCLNALPRLGCNVPENQIRCPHGIAGFQRLEYVLEKKAPSKCCAGIDVACKIPNQKLLEVLRSLCTNKPTCSIPLYIEETVQCIQTIYIKNSLFQSIKVQTFFCNNGKLERDMKHLI